MKRVVRYITLALMLALVFSSLGITAASADSETFYSVDFNGGIRVGLWERHPYNIFVYESGMTLSVTSSDESVIGTELEKSDKPNQYVLYLLGYKKGVATITITASDGTSTSRNFTVGEDIPYSISSDTTQNFSISKGSSYIMKIHYVNSDPHTFMWPDVVSDNENIIKPQILDYNPDANHDYFFRIDPVGNIGQSAALSIGDYNHILRKLCEVTIGANKNLRLDTTAQYTCDVGATYRFIAFTTAKTAPAVSADSGLIRTKYEGKVTGEYLYSITSLLPGETLVRVTSNGESASFPVSINLQKIISDTPASINLPLGKTYTYKLKSTGSTAPSFYTDTPSSLAIVSAKKEGGYYYVKVAAKGSMKGGSYLMANFPIPKNRTDSVNVGYVSVTDPAAPAPKSDTTTDVVIPKGSSYTFKLTNAEITVGDSSLFKCELVKKDKYDSYYKITAVGPNVSMTQVFMDYGDQEKFLCWVINNSTAQVKSDTTYDFSLKPGGSYIFKLTSASPKLNFYTDNSTAFKTTIIKHTGNDYYCKLTASGYAMAKANIYASIPNSSTTPKKICIVTIIP